MEAVDLVTTVTELRSDYTGRGQRKEKIVMGGVQRPRRRRWRSAKVRRKLQKAAKDSGQKATPPNEAHDRDQTDRLLLSALKYWEVERDLIEERLANMRSATAAS